MTQIIEPPSYIIRTARTADIPAIRAMQERSMLVLGGSFYSDEEISSFLTQYGTMDDAVIDEGHFFVAADPAGRILGSGGWSRRRPDYHQGLEKNPETEALPAVRSVFVDPAAERRGVASSIMARLERDAVEYGVRELSLTATLSGVALYDRLGYRRRDALQLALNDNTGFACIRMTKRLEAGHQVAA